MDTNEAIRIRVHLKMLQRVDTTANAQDKVSSLSQAFPGVDFYRHGERLDGNLTFQQCGINQNSQIHTYDSGRPMFSFDIFFKFHNGDCIKLNVPHVWTFHRAAEELSKLTGLDFNQMRMVFAGRQLQPDYAFMDESGMQKETTIHVVLRQQ